MSSTLQALVTAIQQNNYASLAVLTAVGYDFILVFPKEVEYIWSKQWTWVSTLFIIVRYCGLYNTLYSTLYGTSFLPGPTKVGEIFTYTEQWSYVLFLGAADYVMILHVWVMYNRSRLIFGTLLFFFSLQMITRVLAEAVGSDILKDDQLFTIQVEGYSFCSGTIGQPVWTEVTLSFQVTFGAVLCTLAIIQFARQSLRMRRATKQWHSNRYINLIITQGILYFFVNFLLVIFTLSSVLGKIPGTGWQFILLLIVDYVPIYTLTPRFIISIRELYADDIRGERGGGIDTGFGLGTWSSHNGIAQEPMIFATGVRSDVSQNIRVMDDGQNEGTENIEEVSRDIGLAQPV